MGDLFATKFDLKKLEQLVRDCEENLSIIREQQRERQRRPKRQADIARENTGKRIKLTTERRNQKTATVLNQAPINAATIAAAEALNASTEAGDLANNLETQGEQNNDPVQTNTATDVRVAADLLSVASTQYLTGDIAAGDTASNEGQNRLKHAASILAKGAEEAATTASNIAENGSRSSGAGSAQADAQSVALSQISDARSSMADAIEKTADRVKKRKALAIRLRDCNQATEDITGIRRGGRRTTRNQNPNYK